MREYAARSGRMRAGCGKYARKTRGLPTWSFRCRRRPWGRSRRTAVEGPRLAGSLRGFAAWPLPAARRCTWRRWVLDAVPPGQRDDHGVPVPVRCPVGVQDRGTTGEGRGGPARAGVAGGGGRDPGGQAKVLQDCPGGALWQGQVFRRPGVDARRQDRRLRPAQPLRQGGVAAEDEAADAGQAWPQAPPRVLGVLVVVVDADVAAPDDGRASPRERFRHGCRLGVVQHHHVSGGDQGRQRPGVVEGSAVQRRQLLDPEHVAIARLALQVVMKALTTWCAIRLLGRSG